MKKLFCLFLIVLLVLPSAVFAEDPDPIIGCWYLYYDKTSTPEMESAFPGSDKVVCVYLFHENGVVYVTGATITGTTGEPEFSSCGKWEKTDYQYKVSLIGMGEGRSFIENDSLFIEVQENTGMYMKFYKLYPFNPYKDYVRK